VKAGEQFLLEGKPGTEAALGAAERVYNVAKTGGCYWAK
jgi:hypothetical protein